VTAEIAATAEKALTEAELRYNAGFQDGVQSILGRFGITVDNVAEAMAAVELAVNESQILAGKVRYGLHPSPASS
jgi:hypothetical protein